MDPSTSQRFKDKFDYCLAACRTSSLSVINEKEWKSPLKYCYPKDGITHESVKTFKPSSSSISDTVESFPKGSTVNGRSSSVAQFPTTENEESAPQDGPKELKNLVPESGQVGGTQQPDANSPQQSVSDTRGVDEKIEDIKQVQNKQENLLESLQEQLSKLMQENQQLSSQLEEHKRESERLAHQLEQNSKQNKSLSDVVKTSESTVVSCTVWIVLLLFVWLLYINI